MADNNKTMIRRGISTVAEVETAVNEKAREEYVDAQDTATIEAAKAYTDTQIATRETPAGAQDKADSALMAAKEYTETREGVIRTDFEQGDADALAEAAKELAEAISALKGDASADYDTLKKLQTKIEVINEAISGTATPDTIDTLNEALAFIREHQGEIESLVNTYVKKEAIANDLTTNDATQILSAAQGVALKALIDAVTVSLSGYVEKVNGAGLMTDAEREKLSGIEAGANAYTLPAASASTLGGVKAGDNVTIAEDGTLSAAAEPYELPKASASILGGIKVGNNLSIREDGTLDAEAGGGGTVAVSPDAGNTLEQRENGLFVPAGSGGGSGDGGGILVLPYVAPQRDADGNLTNSAAYVNAWGGILSACLAAPDSHALYMEIDAGEGIMLRMPCNLMNMGGEADAIQWLISGFTVVNAPLSPTDPVPCKATCMANVVCNAAGEMQSLVMYASEGIVGADGQPNLLGADDAVIVAIPNDATEEQLKAIMQPVLAALQVNPKRRVVIQYGFLLIPATTAITDAEFLIAALDANPLTVSDPDSKWVVKVQVYCKLSNGVIQSATGGVTAYELATTEAMTAALAGKAALVPFSLEEQLVPGEFWDGRQVYVKTYSRTLPSSLSGLSSFTGDYLITPAFDGYDVKKNRFEIKHSSIPIAKHYMQFVDIWMTSEGYLAFVLHKTLSEYILGGAVTITIKYTKHD